MNAAEWLIRLDGIGFHTVRILLSILWQSSIVFIAALILTRILYKRSAALRHLIWVGAVLAVPLIPPLTLTFEALNTPRTPIEIIPSYRTPRAETAESGGTAGESEKNVMVFESVDPPPRPPVIHFELRKTDKPEERTAAEKILAAASIPFRYPWATVMLLYAAASVFLLGVIGHGVVRIRGLAASREGTVDERCRLAFETAAAKLGLARAPALIGTDEIDIPMSVGLLYPVVCIPVGLADGLTEEELETVAIHELTHIRRRDPLTLTIVSFVRAVFFFHPLLWIASRQVSHLAEQSCDDAVIDHTEEPLLYAKLLVRLAERLPATAYREELAAGLLFSRRSFINRVEAILSDRREQFRKLSRIAAAGIAITALMSLMIALALPLGEQRTIPDDTILVRGTVDYMGSPVPGAELFVVVGDYWFFDETTVRRRTRTDRGGSFEILVPSLSRRLRRQPVSIVAYHPFYALGWVRLSDNPGRTNVRISLRQPGTITGAVTDDNGRILPGALVSIRHIGTGTVAGSRGNSLYLNGLFPGNSVTTGADGRFTIETIPADANAGLYVSADGFAHRVQYGIQADSRVRITLEPEARLEGRVTFAETGEPAGGIEVFARADVYERQASGFGSAVTGEDGRYRIDGLPAGLYTVYASFDSGSELTAAPNETVELAAGRTTVGIDLELIPGGLIEGRIVDADSGDPIAGHYVSLKKPDRNYLVAETTTDENGRYRLRSVPGNVIVAVNAPPGYLREYRKRHVEVTDGGAVDGVDIAFTRGATLEGRVLTADGSPVEKAVVLHRRFHQETETDRDGRFRLTGLRRGMPLSLTVRHEDRRLHAAVSFDDVPDEPVDVVVTEYECTTITGKVVDGNGAAVPGAEVHLMSWDPVAKMGRSRIAALSAADGSFTIDDIAVGEEYALACGMLYVKTDRFVAREAMNPFVLTMPRTDRWLAGRTVDGNGDPIAGVRIIVNGGPSGWRTSMSGRDGTFRMDRLAGLDETVTFQHQDFGYHVYRHVLTNRERNFVLERADRWLEGKVVDADGNPLEGVSVSADQAGQGSRSGHRNLGATTDSSGQFRLSGLKNETETIKLWHNVYGSRTEETVPTNKKDAVFVLHTSSSSEPRTQGND